MTRIRQERAGRVKQTARRKVTPLGFSCSKFIDAGRSESRFLVRPVSEVIAKRWVSRERSTEAASHHLARQAKRRWTPSFDDGRFRAAISKPSRKKAGRI